MFTKIVTQESDDGCYIPVQNVVIDPELSVKIQPPVKFCLYFPKLDVS